MVQLSRNKKRGLRKGGGKLKKGSPLDTTIQNIKRFLGLTPSIETRLINHRAKHLKSGNSRGKVDKHMEKMIEEIKQGNNFTEAHIIAQKIYPMK